MKSDSIDNIFMEKYEKYSKILFRIAFFSWEAPMTQKMFCKTFL